MYRHTRKPYAHSYGALTCDQIRVKFREFTVPGFATEDIESSVVRFRFGDPTDNDFTGIFHPFRTELR